jgi:hypothetical protein
VKLSLKGRALMMAAELKPYNVAAIAVTPGFLRSEAMLERFGVTEANWRDGGRRDSNFLQSETPLFVGRAVAALAADPHVIERSGQLYSSWELAKDYGFTDADGSRPDWGSHAIDWTGFPPDFMDYFRNGGAMQLKWLEALTERTRQFVAKIPGSG